MSSSLVVRLSAPPVMYAMSKWLLATCPGWTPRGDSDWLDCPLMSYDDDQCILVLAGGVACCGFGVEGWW